MVLEVEQQEADERHTECGAADGALHLCGSTSHLTILLGTFAGLVEVSDDTIELLQNQEGA